MLAEPVSDGVAHCGEKGWDGEEGVGQRETRRIRGAVLGLEVVSGLFDERVGVLESICLLLLLVHRWLSECIRRYA